MELDLHKMTPADIRAATNGLKLREPGERTAADIRADMATLWPAAAAAFMAGKQPAETKIEVVSDGSEN